MRKRKNTPEDPEEDITEMETGQEPEENEQTKAEDTDGEDEEEIEKEDEKPLPTDESLPSKFERFTRRDEIDHKKKISLKDILGGEILTRATFRKQFGLIAMCVFYIIVYITNRYQAQQELIEIQDLKEELQKIKYYSLTRSGEYTIRSRQSQIEKMLKQTPDSMLGSSQEPPFIIRTNTEEEK